METVETVSPFDWKEWSQGTFSPPSQTVSCVRTVQLCSTSTEGGDVLPRLLHERRSEGEMATSEDASERAKVCFGRVGTRTSWRGTVCDHA